MKNLPDKILWQGGCLDFSRGALIMGILNVTPDSFSDGGAYLDTGAAVAHGLEMAAHGAAIIDVGPESTRPGSKPVPAAEQINRAVPVIQRLANELKIPVSIDTSNLTVAKAALDAGASMLNDITALSDESLKALAAQRRIPVILMHMRGTPPTMQQNPVYGDVVKDVKDFLLERAASAIEVGVKQEHIILDPGIGFGKTIDHNLELLRNLDVICDCGYRALVGTSRKAFIGKLTGKDNASDRDFGTAATVALAIAKGASIVRVHNVAVMADVAAVANAIVYGNTV